MHSMLPYYVCANIQTPERKGTTHTMLHAYMHAPPSSMVTMQGKAGQGMAMYSCSHNAYMHAPYNMHNMLPYCMSTFKHRKGG